MRYPSKNEPAQQLTKEELALELVRMAELERDDLDLSNEFDAAIFSTWYLLDPLGTKNRESVGTTHDCDEILPKKLTKRFRFTAHSHHNEPLTPSPDDLVIYNRNKRLGVVVNFIMDRFFCKKIK